MLELQIELETPKRKNSEEMDVLRAKNARMQQKLKGSGTISLP